MNDDDMPPVNAGHLAAFMARDLELATLNVQRALHDGPASVSELRDVTLHPRSTVLAALGVLVRARRIARRDARWTVVS